MKISKYFNNEDFKLCYVEGHKAYFTTQPLDRQWGDDWDDAPYEHNAGTPYEPTVFYGSTRTKKDANDWNADGTPKWEVLGFYFSSGLCTPDEYHVNSPYSVEKINEGVVPWLRSADWQTNKVSIMAGINFPDFVKAIQGLGGEVHVPLSWLNSGQNPDVSDTAEDASKVNDD